MSESGARPPTADGADRHNNSQASQSSQVSNTDRDLSRLDMPPLAAELQASDIHHPDAASPVEAGEFDGTGTDDRDPGSDGATGGIQDPVMANFWAAVRRLPSYFRLAASLATDRRIPRSSKAILAVGGAYAVSPIDFIPGIIPVAGQLDDLYVLLTALQQAIRAAPAEVATEHLERAGIQRSDLDDDLAAVRALVRKAAKTTLRVGGRLAKRTSRQVMAMASRSLERGRRAGDNEPL
jgi:uncharacterized membrane protein YkvA (DUF1232 family)